MTQNQQTKLRIWLTKFSDDELALIARLVWQARQESYRQGDKKILPRPFNQHTK